MIVQRLERLRRGVVPTFHEALGVRLRGHQVELWTRDEVESLVVERDFSKELAACRASPRPEGPGGRDGLLLLVRAPEEIECWSTSGEHPWFELARELLNALPSRKVIAALRSYLPASQ